MRKTIDLKLPREHGAWAMLYLPFAIGALAFPGSWLSVAPLLLFLSSVTFIFVARESLIEWWRARSRGRPCAPARRIMLIYLGLGGLFGAPLLLSYRLVWLAPIAILIALLFGFNTLQVARGKDRAVASETVAIVGLTVTAPAASYIASGIWNANTWLLWALCVLYFTSSVFYVKLRVHSLNRRREELKKQSWRRCAAYHVFLAAALVLLAATGDLNVFVLVAFIPVMARAVWQLARPARRTSLQRVGVLEIIYSVVFLVFITMSFRAI